MNGSAPHVYLIDSKVVGRDTIDPVISEHLIDAKLIHKPFTEELYGEFLADRKKRILDAIGEAVRAEPIAEQPDVV